MANLDFSNASSGEIHAGTADQGRVLEVLARHGAPARKRMREVRTLLVRDGAMILNSKDPLEKAQPGGWAFASGSLERETGFEPATSTLARLHSTAELLPLSFPNRERSI